MYSTLASYWTMMPNEYGHIHTGQKTNEWSIDYHCLQITIKTCNKQVVQQQTHIIFAIIRDVLTSEVRFLLTFNDSLKCWHQQ